MSIRLNLGINFYIIRSHSHPKFLSKEYKYDCLVI